MRIWKHFKTITKHKLLVMKYCFKLGLYKQGLLHDLSKYSWIEFSAGIKYYKGYVSPNGIQKLKEGCSPAWLHHKGRNKHHFEYWTDYVNGEYKGIEMEIKYVIEMFCDRVVASQVYMKENYHDGCPLEYFLRTTQDDLIMHPKTKELIESLFIRLRDNGLNETIDYIKFNKLK